MKPLPIPENVKIAGIRPNMDWQCFLKGIHITIDYDFEPIEIYARCMYSQVAITYYHPAPIIFNLGVLRLIDVDLKKERRNKCRQTN